MIKYPEYVADLFQNVVNSSVVCRRQSVYHIVGVQGNGEAQRAEE